MSNQVCVDCVGGLRGTGKRESVSVMRCLGPPHCTHTLSRDVTLITYKSRALQTTPHRHTDHGIHENHRNAETWCTQSIIIVSWQSGAVLWYLLVAGLGVVLWDVVGRRKKEDITSFGRYTL